MAQRFSIAEARSQLPTLVHKAEAGSTIELTRRGKAVAVLLSIADYQRAISNRARFREAYREFREAVKQEELDFDSAFFASLRDRTPGRKVRL